MTLSFIYLAITRISVDVVPAVKVSLGLAIIDATLLSEILGWL